MSAAQQTIHHALRSLGYTVHICNSEANALAVIADALALTEPDTED